jgi:hypothetical protein|tara:strand:- start:5626 stop:6378 length:753 start_codon:yes stop_codon:yes gene_type:complete
MAKDQEVATIQTNYPVLTSDLSELREVIAANVGQAGMTEFDLPRLKVPAGGGLSWQIETMSGTTEEKIVSGIIIHWRDVRGYWAQSFDESGGGSPPDCSSDDAVVGAGKPGGDCAVCPLAQFGSDDKGRGQACKAMRLLFMLQPGKRFPTVVVAPPTSLRNLRKYFLNLANESYRYSAVMTELALEKDKSADGISYSKIIARPAGILDDEIIAAAERYAEAIMPHLAAQTIDGADYHETTAGESDRSASN